MTHQESILPPITREAHERFRQHVIERLREIARTPGRQLMHDKIVNFIEELAS